MDKGSAIYDVPLKREERTALRKQIANFASVCAFVPPLSMKELAATADRIIAQYNLAPAIKGWLMVEINNTVWRERVAAIPYEKRILLIPKCLSRSDKCRAEFDEFGLLCHRCMNCRIPDLQDKADTLGMMSIVAEGFTSVIELIRNNVIDTVIGVGCLESLEKAFPLLIDNAVPGFAVPLNVAGCKDTNVDYDYVESLMTMLSEPDNRRFYDYEHLKTTVREWFTDKALREIIEFGDDLTATTAFASICNNGKRWRPYLLTAIYMALTDNETVPDEIRYAAIAVECFHKASLIHDDIQDNDTVRYGEKTVNALHGTAFAINVGDLLLGEGYRLLARCENAGLIKVAAEAHVALCRGQGAELEWCRSPKPLTMNFVLDIIRNKTVPAFEVSLMIGLMLGEQQKGASEGLQKIIKEYATALGIAYQLHDDIDDFKDINSADSLRYVEIRPSAVTAAICELQPEAKFTAELLQTTDIKAFMNREENKPLLDKAICRVEEMTREYGEKALDALQGINNSEVKCLLFRLTKKILR